MSDGGWRWVASPPFGPGWRAGSSRWRSPRRGRRPGAWSGSAWRREGVCSVGGTDGSDPRVHTPPAGLLVCGGGVLVSPLSRGGGVGGMAEQPGGEVIGEPSGAGLPALPRPLLWVEHRPARRRGPGRYALLTFPSYHPRPAGAGFVRRVTLGAPRRELLTPEEDAFLTGGEAGR